jgi:hypothetical protein
MNLILDCLSRYYFTLSIVRLKSLEMTKNTYLHENEKNEPVSSSVFNE